jgi:hypothetical protein
MWSSRSVSLANAHGPTAARETTNTHTEQRALFHASALHTHTPMTLALEGDEAWKSMEEEFARHARPRQACGAVVASAIALVGAQPADKMRATTELLEELTRRAGAWAGTGAGGAGDADGAFEAALCAIRDAHREAVCRSAANGQGDPVWSAAQRLSALVANAPSAPSAPTAPVARARDAHADQSPATTHGAHGTFMELARNGPMMATVVSGSTEHAHARLASTVIRASAGSTDTVALRQELTGWLLWSLSCHSVVCTGRVVRFSLPPQPEPRLVARVAQLLDTVDAERRDPAAFRAAARGSTLANILPPAAMSLYERRHGHAAMNATVAFNASGANADTVRHASACQNKHTSHGWEPDVTAEEAARRGRVTETRGANQQSFADPRRTTKAVHVPTWIRSSVPAWMQTATEDAWAVQAWAEHVNRLAHRAMARTSTSPMTDYFREFVYTDTQTTLGTAMGAARERLASTVRACPPRVVRIGAGAFAVACDVCKIVDVACDVRTACYAWLKHTDACCQGQLCQTVSLWDTSQ